MLLVIKSLLVPGLPGHLPRSMRSQMEIKAQSARREEQLSHGFVARLCYRPLGDKNGSEFTIRNVCVLCFTRGS